MTRLPMDWQIHRSDFVAWICQSKPSGVSTLMLTIAENKPYAKFQEEAKAIGNKRSDLYQLLRDKFPEDSDVLEGDRRIDFLCVRESTNLVVVEIKRPKSKVSRKELDQIEDYVIFMRDYVGQTSDPDYKFEEVTGYLLCGNLVDTYQVRGERQNLARSQIYVRRYIDLLDIVKRAHDKFLERYNQLQEAKQRAANNLDSWYG